MTQATLRILSSGIHDVKNMLEVARAQLPNGINACDEASSLIGRAQDRLSRMLFCYRLEENELRLNLDYVSLDVVVQEALLSCSMQLGGRKSVLIESACRPIALFDRDLVCDMISNAMQNAIRHSEHTIVVRILPGENYGVGSHLPTGCSIEIHDDGPGFGSFQNVNRLISEGNGLYIARHIAALHANHGKQGRLVLGSSPLLGGALFRLELP